MVQQLGDVYRGTYVGVGAHPRLLPHAIAEIHSYIKRMYNFVRILFPALPSEDRPIHLDTPGLTESLFLKRKYLFICLFILRWWTSTSRISQYVAVAGLVTPSLPVPLHSLRVTQSETGRSILGSASKMESSIGFSFDELSRCRCEILYRRKCQWQSFLRYLFYHICPW